MISTSSSATSVVDSASPEPANKSAVKAETVPTAPPPSFIEDVEAADEVSTGGDSDSQREPRRVVFDDSLDDDLDVPDFLK